MLSSPSQRSTSCRSCRHLMTSACCSLRKRRPIRTRTGGKLPNYWDQTAWKTLASRWDCVSVYRSRSEHNARMRLFIFLKHNKICLFNCGSALCSGCCTDLVDQKGRNERKRWAAKGGCARRKKMGCACKHIFTLQWFPQTHPQPGF